MTNTWDTFILHNSVQRQPVQSSSTSAHYTTVWYDFAATHDDISWMWTLHIGVLTYWCLNVDMSRRYAMYICWYQNFIQTLVDPVSGLHVSCCRPCPDVRGEDHCHWSNLYLDLGTGPRPLVAVAACVKSVFMCLLPLMCLDHFISLSLSLAWLYYPTVRKVVVGYNGYQHENKLSLIDIWTFTFGHIIV